MSAGICGFEICFFFFYSRFGVEMHDSRLRVLGSNPGVPVESVKFVVFFKGLRRIFRLFSLH